MSRRSLLSYLVALCLSSGVIALPPAAWSAEGPDVFRAFTAHIQRQVDIDKQQFVAAQVCTEWFYKEFQRPRAPRPPADAVTFVPAERPLSVDERSDCRRRYDGLDAARKEFSRAQSALSVSLTFYEFALVGDRDDDDRYSDTEIQDMIESFGLPFNEVLPAAAHLTALKGQFDTIQRDLGLEALMAGMGVLYDRGYRLSSHDQAALSRVAR
jgi:hypothetical protein